VSINVFWEKHDVGWVKFFWGWVGQGSSRVRCMLGQVVAEEERGSDEQTGLWSGDV
jgi:hypothetical protein